MAWRDGDIELLVDYKTVPKADSGIYLRGVPQVQIWDYTEQEKFKLGADKGYKLVYANGVNAFFVRSDKLANPEDFRDEEMLVFVDQQNGRRVFRLFHFAERVERVERRFAEETAATVRGLRPWITNEYEHHALRADGERVLDRQVCASLLHLLEGRILNLTGLN